MTCIDGGVLRKWRRSRGWDVPALAREMRRTAGGDPLPFHDALVRMIRRWEREGLNTRRAERYELLYAAVFGVRPEDLRIVKFGADKQPEQDRAVPSPHGPDMITAIAGTLHTVPDDYPQRDRAALKRDVLRAWELRQSSQYVELGSLIAGLLRDTAVSQVDPGIAVHICNMASSLLKSVGAHEMSAMLADRAFRVASQDGGGLLIGAAKLRIANVYLAAGRHAEAVSVAAAAADDLPPARTSPPKEIATFGALLLTAAVAAARTGDRAQAWEFLGHARAATAVSGGEHADLYAVFGPANLAVHGVQVATELGDGREALRRAEMADPARLPAVLLERRSTLLIDIARAQHMQRDSTGAGETLLEAERVAPLEVRYSSAARGLLGDLLSGGRVSGEMRALAERLNVAA
ncbi:MAG TPA: hypothetical protein VGI74_16120 [Streptosporangiaceae bacterium]|jgi:hypothetical protein